jgi:hypothetical protein
MAVLSKIKTSKTARIDNNDGTVRRRTKLIEKLQEQMLGAEALIAGKLYQPTKTITQKNADGEHERVQQPKRFRAWYWHDVAGVWHTEVRYGAKVLKLNSKGDTAITVGNKEALPTTLQLVIDAVYAGELDAAIDAVAVTRKLIKK